MTLAWGSVGSEATLLSGGGRRAEAGPVGPEGAAPLAEPEAALSATTPLDEDRDRIRKALGFGSRACKYSTFVRYTYTYLPLGIERAFAEISLHEDASELYHPSLPQTSVGQYKVNSVVILLNDFTYFHNSNFYYYKRGVYLSLLLSLYCYFVDCESVG